MRFVQGHADTLDALAARSERTPDPRYPWTVTEGPWFDNNVALCRVTPGGLELNSVFLTPVAITKDNLNVVIDAGWVGKDVVCQGVAAGSVAACN